MSDLNHKLRRSRRFRLELLESRELLSGVGLAARQAAEISPLKAKTHEIITGSLSGQGSVVPITLLRGTTSFHSSGTMTVLGPATLDGSVSYSANKLHIVKYASGVGTLADASGDDINISYSGTGRDVGAGDFTFSVKGSVTGGTGIYSGAKGSLTGKGSLDAETGVFSIQLTTTLTHT